MAEVVPSYEESKQLLQQQHESHEFQGTQEDSLLNFQVFHSTSQDAGHTVNELTANARDPNNLVGWHSQRFCIFPQELIVQFQGPVKITQIKLLAHETKIPNKVELYSFMPGVDNNIQDTQPGISTIVTPQSSNHLFRRLGHFSLDSNEQSGYQSRELKTVHLGVTCSFFKLVLHKNHDNGFNLFS